MKHLLVKRTFLSILLLVITTRLVMLFTGYVGMNLFAHYETPPVYERQPPTSFNAVEMKLPGLLEQTTIPNWVDFFKFDSLSYLSIATEGYAKYNINEPHPAANWVFFPLYPLLLFSAGKLLGLLMVHNMVIIGIILSNLFFFISFIYIYLVCVQQRLSARQARAVLLLIAIYPTSFYFSLPYTESLFLMLSAASIYYAKDKKYALAFLFASLSTVTRVPGFINLFFVGGVFLLNEGLRSRGWHVRLAVYSFLSLLPMGMFLVHMKQLTGDYLAPFHEQSLHWFRHSSAPFANYAHYFVQPYFIAPGGWDNGLLSFVMSTAVFLVYIIYFVAHWKDMLKEPQQLLFYIYGALLLVIPFSSQPWYLSSVVRYMMVCIPFYIYLVKLTARKQNVRLTYQLLFFAFAVINIIGFFNGYHFMA